MTTYRVQFTGDRAESGHTRHGFTDVRNARAWAIEHLVSLNTQPSNPYSPTLLIIRDRDNEIIDSLTRNDV